MAQQKINLLFKLFFNFVENSWCNKKNHQHDNFKIKLYKLLVKTNKIKKHIIKQLIIFFNAKYEKLLECLENSASFIKESKTKLLKETIKLIKNNEEGVKNQTLWNNIGYHIEGDISYYCKGVSVKKATYREKTIKNKLNTSMMNFKNKINLFNTNEPLE